VDKYQFAPRSNRIPLFAQTKFEAMRKALLSFVITLTAATAIIAQNPLPNPGFEDWSSFSGGIGSTYEEPNNWNTANQCSQLLGTYSVTKSSTFHSGSFAAELKTRNAFLGSIKINGVMSTAEIICATNSGGQEGGIATNALPDSIAFWYQYTPVDVDTAYVQIILFSGEDTVSFLKGKIHLATSEWTRASFAIPTPTAAPDMISTFFNSSWGDGSAGQAFVGSILLVDDVEYIYATGIEEDEAAAKWEVYPNPVQDILNIRNSSGDNATLEVLDATGRTVLNRAITQMETRLDVSALPMGIYLYQLRNSKDQIIKTGKLIRGL
jgi:hypothetical protein